MPLLRGERAEEGMGDPVRAARRAGLPQSGVGLVGSGLRLLFLAACAKKQSNSGDPDKVLHRYLPELN